MLDPTLGCMGESGFRHFEYTQSGPVITSYSIHYTKLYDNGLGEVVQSNRKGCVNGEKPLVVASQFIH